MLTLIVFQKSNASSTSTPSVTNATSINKSEKGWEGRKRLLEEVSCSTYFCSAVYLLI